MAGKVDFSVRLAAENHRFLKQATQNDDDNSLSKSLDLLVRAIRKGGFTGIREVITIIEQHSPNGSGAAHGATDTRGDRG